MTLYNEFLNEILMFTDNKALRITVALGITWGLYWAGMLVLNIITDQISMRRKV